MDKAEGEKLLRDNAELRAQVAKLVEQIATSNELIAKLNERVGELLAAAQRRHRKPTPEKPAAPPPVVVAPPKPEVAPQIEQNKVAVLLPLTGANAAVGQSIANAANMALLDAGDKRINLRVSPKAGLTLAHKRSDEADHLRASDRRARYKWRGKKCEPAPTFFLPVAVKRSTFSHRRERFHERRFRK